MLETKQQKQYFFTAITAIIILLIVSFWHHPDFVYHDTTNYNQKPTFDYNQYLASINVDPKASQQLFESVVSEQDVQNQVDQELETNRPIVPPPVDKNLIHLTSASGADSLVGYFSKAAGLIINFDDQASSTATTLFGPGQQDVSVNAAIAANQSLVNNLYQLEVPKEVLQFHQASLEVYLAYLSTLQKALDYSQSGATSTWPAVYNNYAVINSNMAIVREQVDRLSQKYNLAAVPLIKTTAKRNPWYQPQTAQAIFGIGDGAIVLGNIPDDIMQAVQQGLSSAFAKFATTFLNNLITAIEKNYKIANFLYYTDALVQGEYVNDYLSKYVASPLDRAMVTNFIPQFTCGQAKDVKKILQAKADQYLGFDPATVSPQDPNYYTKMAKIGDFMSSPDGWEVYYDSVAASAQTAAQQAANQELLSSGLKSPRDAMGQEIAQSLTSISGSMQAAFNAQLNLGIANAKETVGAIVSNITYSLFNNFVFKGAVVYKEQGSCVPVPQLQPVIPAAMAAYVTPSPVDTNAIQNQACSQIRGGCPTPSK